MERETMEFDVVIVGAGPAGLAAAIRIKQQAGIAAQTVSVCVVEKGSEVGAHIVSGAVIDPVALDELFSDWQDRGAPLTTPVVDDRFLFLTARAAHTLPTPPQMRNSGHFVASMGALTRWLGEQAEALGVEIFPGFAATEVLFHGGGDENPLAASPTSPPTVKGIATGDMGRTKTGDPGANFEPGVALHATYTLFAEGCRGSLSQQLMETFELRHDAQPQTYGLGIKELWEVKPDQHKPGTVIHTIGWPLTNDVYGGSFIYHLDNNLVAVGLIVGLDYENPYLSPFDEMQRFKTHPKIRPLFDGGRRIAYGARALNEGGFQAIPKLIFPGGALIGAAAGFMNVPRIKGSHTAMKSAIECADAVVAALAVDRPALLQAYPETLQKSWLWRELYAARNIRPAFRAGLWAGVAYAALDTYLLRGRAPWTFSQHADHLRLKRAQTALKITYPSPDGMISFDKLSSVFLSNTNHEEDQPCHLTLKDADVPNAVNWLLYEGPEQRYCPAGVYEFIDIEDQTEHQTRGKRLQINAQNCIHCKTCDIKDPRQNIIWTPPQGGGGPNYPNM